jgi:predicted alpha/beta hydrolase
MTRVMDATPTPVPLHVQAADGYALRGRAWLTSVRCEYYGRFAAFLHGRGFDVYTYDYRGIGNSRPASLRGFEADWLHWGGLDFEAVLRAAAGASPGQPVHVVGHSAGGFLVGLAPSNALVERVFMVGAQYAYWPDYLGRRRLGMLLRWHLLMPLLTAAFGYFPGKRLGWLEDTPRGVVRDWTARHARFEDAYRGGARALDDAARADLVRRFAAMRAQILALGLDDDEYGTVAAVQRLLRYFGGSRVTHLHLSAAAAGMAPVGHFGFFHARHERSLWPLALEWLQHGRVAPPGGGQLICSPPD